LDVIVKTWNEIRAKQGLSDILLQFKDAAYGDALSMIKSSQVDTLSSGLFLSRRFLNNSGVGDYSRDILNSGMSIMVLKPPAQGSLLKSMFSGALWKTLFIFSVFMFIFGNLYWLVEKETEKEYNDRVAKGQDDSDVVSWKYSEGLQTGIWWTATTMTTVGYGDHAPKTTKGRVLAMVVMLLSLFLVGMFTSSLTAELTTNAISQKPAISTLSDLRSAKVAVVKGTYPYHFLQKASSDKKKISAVGTPSAALKLLVDKKVDAVLGVSDVLKYLGQNSDVSNKVLIEATQYRSHSIVFPAAPKALKAAVDGGLFTDAISDTILALEDDGQVDLLLEKYFPAPKPNPVA